MSELLSVIVPVYNVEPYLKKCLESILSQTYRNMQIILVDDGSTDHSAEICDEYARKDNRILVIHKENEGPVCARKTGLKVAEADFVGWVDSDDWIEPHYFEEMMEAQQESNADIVASNHFHDIHTSSSVIKNSFPVGFYDLGQLENSLLYNGRFFEYGIRPSLCSKLCRRDLLEGVYRDMDESIVAGEDAAAVYSYILECEKICVTDICRYHYVQRPASATRRECEQEAELIKQLIKRLISHLEASFRKHSVYDRMRPQLEQYKKYMLLLRNMQMLEECGIKPYGELPEKSRIILYGAGGVGQRAYRYFADKEMTLIGWIDQGDTYYREMGFEVAHPEEFLKNAPEYDFILIAVITETTAEAIKRYLVDKGVPEKKIRWFSEKITEERYTITL